MDKLNETEIRLLLKGLDCLLRNNGLNGSADIVRLASKIGVLLKEENINETKDKK